MLNEDEIFRTWRVKPIYKTFFSRQKSPFMIDNMFCLTSIFSIVDKSTYSTCEGESLYLKTFD
jgi:hypothetical protein